MPRALLVMLALGSVEGCNCQDTTSAMNDLSAVDNDGGGGDGGDGGEIADFAETPEDLTGLDLAQSDGIIISLPDGGTAICFIAYCQAKLWQCGDCKDNDNDGLIDAYDPDCLGPCQNNELGFFGNIPGQNNAPCKADCYWDQDTGSGNDQCYWDHGCDPFEDQMPLRTMPEIGCRYDQNTKVGGATVPAGQKDCTYLLSNQQTACTNFCEPLTPNGCDCFGCCENPLNLTHYVWAGSENASGAGTCDRASLNDATKCKACTPVVGCSKPCGRCQLCFGKTAADLPADCANVATDGGGPPPPSDMANALQCPGGEQPCGLPGQPECFAGYYCITGCCQPLIIP